MRLRIERGMLHIGSLDCPGFGTPVVPVLDGTRPMPTANWPTPPAGAAAKGQP